MEKKTCSRSSRRNWLDSACWTNLMNNHFVTVWLVNETRFKERKSIMTRSSSETKTVVLVHGGFVDGSGWEGVYNVLRKDGYTVAIVQNPTLSLADDVAVTKRAIAAQDGGTADPATAGRLPLP